MSAAITEADGALWDYACDVDTALGERGAEPLTEDDLVREFRGIGHSASHAAAMILAQRIGTRGRAEPSATVETPVPVVPPEASEPVRDGEVVQGASLAIPSADVQARHLICQEHQVYATFTQALCPYCARAERQQTLPAPKPGVEAAAADGWPIEALRGDPKVTAETVAGEIQEDFLPFDNKTLPSAAPVRDTPEATAGAVPSVTAEPAVPMPLPVALSGEDEAEATAANAAGPAAAVPIVGLVLRLPRAVSVAEGHAYAVALGRREGTRKLPARVDLMQTDGTTIDVASLEPARTTRKRTHDADAEVGGHRAHGAARGCHEPGVAGRPAVVIPAVSVASTAGGRTGWDGADRRSRCRERAATVQGGGKANMTEDANGWRLVNEETPRGVRLMFWWVPVGDNVWEEVCVLGTLHWHLSDKWWNDQTGGEQDIAHVRYWRHLPDGPVDRMKARSNARQAAWDGLHRRGSTSHGDVDDRPTKGRPATG